MMFSLLIIELFWMLMIFFLILNKLLIFWMIMNVLLMLYLLIIEHFWKYIDLMAWESATVKEGLGKSMAWRYVEYIKTDYLLTKLSL